MKTETSNNPMLDETNSDGSIALLEINDHSTRGSVLRILVKNHPGVLSHVCGLFSRRAYNLESILCVPYDEGRSIMLIGVNENGRTGQVIRQLRKLEDVHEVEFAMDEKDLLSELSTRLIEGDRAKSQEHAQ